MRVTMRVKLHFAAKLPRLASSLVSHLRIQQLTRHKVIMGEDWK